MTFRATSFQSLPLLRLYIKLDGLKPSSSIRSKSMVFGVASSPKSLLIQKEDRRCVRNEEMGSHLYFVHLWLNTVGAFRTLDMLKRLKYSVKVQIADSRSAIAIVFNRTSHNENRN